MDNITITWVFSITFGIIAGYFIARRSESQDRIHGGAAARAFHYLASAALITVAPGVLCSVVLRDGFWFSLALALGFIGFSLLMLCVYAYFELPARAALAAAPKEDRGWTEEDARKSGL